VVSSFKQAGAHFMGKTNVPFMLGDFQSYNEIYGTTANPWDLDRSPGGSSGGTAAALAAGLTTLDCGSDIGGSIRNPAHYCGIYGHKPTWGIVPAKGQAPPGFERITPPDLAVNGPLARTAADLALALKIIAGPHTLSAPGWKLNLPQPRMKTLKQLRVALWPDEPLALVDSEISDSVARAGEQLARFGARVSDSARPDISSSESHQTYMSLLNVIVSGPEGNIDHQSWMGLDSRRVGYRLRWQEFFRDWDILLCPISATTAFTHDHSLKDQRTLNVNGKQVSYWDQLFWAGIATLSYLPSTVFPTGLSKAGLPIGLQAIGAEFDDRTTIEFARLMADEIGGFVAPPGYTG
jgi:amidase